MRRLAPTPMRRGFFLSHESDTIDLLESGFSGLDQRRRRVAQRDGSRGARRLFKLSRRRTRHDQLPELVVQHQQLADCLTPLEARPAALAAAVALANLAEHAHQALRQDAV